MVDRDHPRPRRSTASGLLLWLALIAVGCSVGCATRIPASPDRGRVVLPPPMRDSDWPSRFPDTLVGSAFAAGTGVLTEVAARPLTKPWNLAILIDPPVSADRWWSAPPIGRYGHGVVYLGELNHDEAFARRRDHSWWIFATTSLTPVELAKARLGETVGWTTDDGRVRAVACVLWESEWEQPRGLAIFLPSLTSGYPERMLRRRLRREGWAVLEVVRPADGQIGGTRSYVTDQPAHRTTQFSRELLERATDFELWMLPMYDYSLTVGYEDNLESDPVTRAEWTVTRVADSFDSILADWSYAAEGMVEFVRANRPDISTESMIVVGCSLGAIVAPTVCARLDGQVDAVVLVGGGADVSHIFTSTIMPGMSGGRSWEALATLGRNRLRQIYLEHSTLDPYHTAPRLAHTPALMLHAIFDSIVPASSGRLLYQRLRRPELWEYPVGHLGLFALLPSQASAIVEWIDRHVPADDRRN